MRAFILFIVGGFFGVFLGKFLENKLSQRYLYAMLVLLIIFIASEAVKFTNLI